MHLSARYIAAVCAVCGGVGCATSTSQSVAADVNPAGWERAVTVTLPVADTLTAYDAVVFLRYNESFAEDTLSLRLTTLAPDSLRCEEWVRMVVEPVAVPAPLSGEAVAAYRRRIRWTQPGNYRIRIEPVRRIRGVEAAGVQLSKCKQ